MLCLLRAGLLKLSDDWTEDHSCSALQQLEWLKDFSNIFKPCWHQDSAIIDATYCYFYDFHARHQRSPEGNWLSNWRILSWSKESYMQMLSGGKGPTVTARSTDLRKHRSNSSCRKRAFPRSQLERKNWQKTIIIMIIIIYCFKKYVYWRNEMENNSMNPT